MTVTPTSNLVKAIDAKRSLAVASTPEQLTVLGHCRLPTPTVDLAADLDLPLGVVRILLADLRELGLIAIRAPVPMKTRQVDKNTLREVLHGLRGL